MDGFGRFLLITAVFLLAQAVVRQLKSCRTVHRASQCALCCSELPANCSSVRMNSAMSVNKDFPLKGTGSIKSTSGAESIKMCGHHLWSSVLMQPFFYSQNMAHWAGSAQRDWGI